MLNGYAERLPMGGVSNIGREIDSCKEWELSPARTGTIPIEGCLAALINTEYSLF